MSARQFCAMSSCCMIRGPPFEPGNAGSRASARVELDDQLLLDRHRDVLARRQGLHDAFEILLVQLEPARHAAPLERLERLDDARHLSALLAQGDALA